MVVFEFKKFPKKINKRLQQFLKSLIYSFLNGLSDIMDLDKNRT